MKISSYLSTLAWMALLTVLFICTVQSQRTWEQIARPLAAGDLEGLQLEILLAQQQREQANTTVLVASDKQEPAPTVASPVQMLGTTLPAPCPLVDEAATLAWHPAVELPAGRNHLAVRSVRSPEHHAVHTGRDVRAVAIAGHPQPALARLQRHAVARAIPPSLADLVLLTPVDTGLFNPIPLVAQQPAPAVARIMRPELVLADAEPSPSPSDAFPELEAFNLAWKRPSRLLTELEKLTPSPECGQWASRVMNCLDQLAAQPGREPSRQLLEQLSSEVELAYSIDGEIQDPATRTQLRLARHALRRRVEIWQTTYALATEHGRTEIATADPARLNTCLAELENIVSGDPQGDGWRQFLLLDSLRGSAGWQNVGCVDPQTRELAELVLQRVDAQNLTAEQRAFLHSPPVARLETELRQWVSPPLPLSDLFACMETYEESGDASDATQLAHWTDQLLNASDPEIQKLGRRLETHYRNHNLRINLTAELVNRFIPAMETRQGRVRDTILGLPVSGRQRTNANLAVELKPDNSGLSLNVKVNGTVAANTCACSGPATMYSRSSSRYTAVTPVRIDSQGIRIEQPLVRVDTNTQLRALETDLDDVPLLGAMVRMYAHNKIDASQDEAIREIEYKVARQIQRELSTEMNKQVTELESELDNHLVSPLSNLELHPLLVAMQSTEDRMVVRGRMAALEQLGAHTPRPQALSDSLASIQIHETALNNAIDRLGLAGREFTPEELHAFLVDRLKLPSHEAPKLVARGVVFKFASHEPVRVRCDDRRVALTVRLDKVENGRQQATNVVVNVTYMPKVDGRSIDLVRDGTVSIEGDGLRGRSYLAIRAVFAKMFPKQRPWETVPDSVLQDERLADLGITQFVIRDGWIGVSVGPKRDKVEDVMVKGPLRRRLVR